MNKINNSKNPVTNNVFKEGAIKYVESIIYYRIENYLKIYYIIICQGRINLTAFKAHIAQLVRASVL